MSTQTVQTDWVGLVVTTIAVEAIADIQASRRSIVERLADLVSSFRVLVIPFGVSISIESIEWEKSITKKRGGKQTKGCNPGLME